MKDGPIMRSDSMPQIETREIADGDLDAISGGTLGDLVRTTAAELPTVTLPTVTGGAGITISGPLSLAANISGATGA
jgi:hypothetical protein